MLQKYRGDLIGSMILGDGDPRPITVADPRHLALGDILPWFMRMDRLHTASFSEYGPSSSSSSFSASSSVSPYASSFPRSILKQLFTMVD